MQILSDAYYYFEACLISLLNSFFFNGAKTLPQEIINERMQILESKDAKKLTDLSVEAYQIPASHPDVEKVVIFANTSGFLQLQPKNYDHLKNVADVVLWNPTQYNPVQYKNDLQAVVAKVRALHPEKTITLMSRCATADPAIAAVADLNDDKIDLVIDRGHGNALKFARSFTILAGLPFVQTILSKYFDCQGEAKIASIKGRVCFLSSPADQLMKWGKQDFMEELVKARQNKEGDQHISLLHSDHWSRWDRTAHKKVYDFMGFKDVDVSAFPEKNEFPHFFKTAVMPWLIKGYC